jgi:hypothetical protein
MQYETTNFESSKNSEFYRSTSQDSQRFPQSIDFSTLPATLVNKHRAAAAISVSPSTLKQYRLAKNSSLIESIHYFYLNSRTIHYNLELLVDWAMHRQNPQAHQKAIEVFLSKLAINKRSKRGYKR